MTPTQAWILRELIRYLEHPAPGAMAFDDMGPHWVAVRDAAHDDKLRKNDRKNDEAVLDVAARWEQLLRFEALRLGSEIGDDVTQVLTRADATTHRSAPATSPTPCAAPGPSTGPCASRTPWATCTWPQTSVHGASPPPWTSTHPATRALAVGARGCSTSSAMSTGVS